MDTSDSEEEQRSRREETMITSFNLLYSPCHICEVFVKTILKCFGYDFPRFQTPHQPTNPPTQDTESEVEMKSNEDAGVGELSSTTAIAAARSRASRPTRPPISAGRGGQNN